MSDIIVHRTLKNEIHPLKHCKIDILYFQNVFY